MAIIISFFFSIFSFVLGMTVANYFFISKKTEDVTRIYQEGVSISKASRGELSFDRLRNLSPKRGGYLGFFV
jgi:hypothetical protein